MSEFTDRLERAREQFPAPDLSLERVIVQRDRRARTHRITAAVLALALVAAGVGAVLSVARDDERLTPADRGAIVPLPTDPDGPCFAGDPCWDLDIFISRPDGTEVTRLGYGPERDLAYSWSPDGSRIAFFVGEGVEGGERIDITADIYTMAGDGTDIRRLTDDPAIDVFPVYSPDGTKVAFQSDRAGTFDIWVMDVDGSNPVRITDFENDTLDDSAPTWSPDGERIAFVRGKFTNGGSGKLWVIDSDGSNGHVLLEEPLVLFPAWSPDGTRIAFEVGETPAVHVEVLEVATGATSDLGAGLHPIWSPDSSMLAVTLQGGGFATVELAEPARRTIVRSTSFFAAAWSPDGDWIVFNDAGLTASDG